MVRLAEIFTLQTFREKTTRCFKQRHTSIDQQGNNGYNPQHNKCFRCGSTMAPLWLRQGTTITKRHERHVEIYIVHDGCCTLTTKTHRIDNTDTDSNLNPNPRGKSRHLFATIPQKTIITCMYGHHRPASACSFSILRLNLVTHGIPDFRRCVH